MYAPAYGFGPGTNSQPFNPNGAPHNPHQQSQQQPGQTQMMYNPQQYAANAGPHQSPYGGAPGSGMGPNASGMGMMQNGGWSHMAGGHVASYQTPYSSSPYGVSVPTSSAANLPPNFTPTTSGAPSFPMNAPSMTPQQMQAQRMQPPSQSSTSTQPGMRSSPYGGIPHTSPPNGPNAQSQFNVPQNANQTTVQTPNNTSQNVVRTGTTPQSASFPAGPHGAVNTGAAVATPLSPGAESREKDRVTLLLEINRELLLEVMRLQAAQLAEKQALEKEEAAASTNSPESTGDKDKTEKERGKVKSVSSREYFECMRRLQGNLAYLAAIADRSHKPSSQIPPHPACMSAPPLSLRPKREVRSSASETKIENMDQENKPESIESLKESEFRVETLKDQYKRLQALFPGADPKHDAQAQSASAAAKAQMQVKQKQAQAQAQAQAQGGQTQVGEQTPQQKHQIDVYRQHMMQQAQQQAVSAQQNESQSHAQNR